MRNTKYTTQLSQGAGLINEVLSLLSVYQKGMTYIQLTDYVRENGTLSCKTDSRLKHIVYDVFYVRLLKNNPDVAWWLKTIRNNGLPLKQFSQLLMIYCARENAVFFDAITKVLNQQKKNNGLELNSNEILLFVKDIVDNGYASWTEKLQRKNAGYIRSTMADFELIDKKGRILPYEPSDFTILYFMHEQHFAGLSDMAIWDLEEWQLFNLDRHQVLAHIMDLSLRGVYIAQTSGDLLTISWNYQTMEDFINATL